MSKVGRLVFSVQDNGILVKAEWSPSCISRVDRQAIANTLKTIAERMEQDLFDTGDGYKFHKAPMPRNFRKGP